MLSSKEIRNNIESIKNTNKITKTMEMISISKMQKMKLLINSRSAYYCAINKIVTNIIQAKLEYFHSYIKNEYKIDAVCIIIVSTEKGLCGSLNNNLFKEVLKIIRQYSEENVKLIVLGKKSKFFFKFFSKNIILFKSNFGYSSLYKNAIKILNIIKNLYNEKKVKKIFLASNRFKNSMTFIPRMFQLLPIYNVNVHKNIYRKHSWDYIYEPEIKWLLDMLFDRYLESKIYYSILENLYCEQSARIVSMKQATDNGNNILKKLQLTYNKHRQYNVTKELIEIVSGYSAIL
ncbi:ATP synthase F1 subunit gamma [Buchnera aphidicola (Chaitoregma tattakana)]|uniref:ATP synthase F1 subunit gamma n=1 Tax=Buchnera aphidicola TaxID=9 RepID=UPI0031B8317A